jgi:DNA-binding CsgD family transcriptional regulator
MKKNDRPSRKLAPPPGLEAFRVEVGGEELVVFRAPAERTSETSELSAAERDVVQGVLEGLGNVEIAKRRGTSARTVENQLGSIFRKLGVGSRAELVSRLLGAKR